MQQAYAAMFQVLPPDSSIDRASKQTAQWLSSFKPSQCQPSRDTPGRIFIARAAGARAVAEGRRSSLVGGPARGLCFFNLEPAMVVGAGVRRGGGRGPRGGWWAARPPARSPAAGVVAGGGGALGFRVAGVGAG